MVRWKHGYGGWGKGPGTCSWDESMNILFIPSKHPPKILWGADFFLKEAQKRSRHTIFSHYGFNNLNPDCSESPWELSDVIHLHNLSTTALDKRRLGGIFPRWKSKIIEYSKLSNRPKIIGGIRGFVGLKKALPFCKYFDAIHVGCSELKKLVEKENPNVYINHPGVDNWLFDYVELRAMRILLGFTVLWAGDVNKKIKNAHLLKMLPFKIKTATKEDYIHHDKMPVFYNSGDVLISLSEREGFCRPVLEAASCSLPVVSTNTGIAPYLLDQEWIVDEDPRTSRGFNEFVDKINILKDDPGLREVVGEKNREAAQKYSWQESIQNLDRIWEGLHLEVR